jgi:hypothetical protein
MVTVFVNKAPETPTDNGQFQPQQSFVQRLLNFQITLDSNPATAQPTQFDTTTGSNTVLLSGFRASVRVTNSGARAGCMAEVVIYGLPQNLMNQLATLGMGFNLVQKNQITIFAGSSNTFTAGLPAVPGSMADPGAQSLQGFSPIFNGTIYFALPDYNQQPNVPIRIMASSPGINAIAPATPASFPGSTNVATAMAGFAKLMNVGFENNNINVTLAPSYYPGTVYQQMRKLAKDAHVNAELVSGAQAGSGGGNGATGEVLAIWPIGGSRTSLNGGGPLPLIGPTSGLIGYPSFANNGWVIVKMLFNPLVGLGSQFTVQSSIPQVNNKTLVVYNLGLMLESLEPKGKWEGTAHCYPLGLPAPAVPQASAG